jgi:hypothetical protein
MTHVDRAAVGRTRGAPSTTPACPGYPHLLSNGLAGLPGHGVMLDVDWADGLVPDSNLIRWVGAPAEITR